MVAVDCLVDGAVAGEVAGLTEAPRIRRNTGAEALSRDPTYDVPPDAASRNETSVPARSREVSTGPHVSRPRGSLKPVGPTSWLCGEGPVAQVVRFVQLLEEVNTRMRSVE